MCTKGEQERECSTCRWTPIEGRARADSEGTCNEFNKKNLMRWPASQHRQAYKISVRREREISLFRWLSRYTIIYFSLSSKAKQCTVSETCKRILCFGEQTYNIGSSQVNLMMANCIFSTDWYTTICSTIPPKHRAREEYIHGNQIHTSST